MSKYWSIDSPLMNGLGTIADIILLNIIYVISCIPIVTIGAATSALYTVTMKMVRKEYPSVIKAYFQAFRRNFKIATVCWLVVLVAGILIWIDFRIVGQSEGTIKSVMRIALGAVLVTFAMVGNYLFPYIARFENNFVNTLRNAFMMSVAHFPFTVVMVGLTVGVAVICFFTGRTFAIATLVFFFFGFALLAYVKSKLFVKIFEKYE